MDKFSLPIDLFNFTLALLLTLHKMGCIYRLIMAAFDESIGSTGSFSSTGSNIRKRVRVESDRSVVVYDFSQCFTADWRLLEFCSMYVCTEKIGWSIVGVH